MKTARGTAASYSVKALDPGDLDRAIEIWSLSFGFLDRDRWAMFYDSFLDSAIGAYLGDYLVAIVGIINFQMWFGDQLLPCAGVSAVAADPAHRRRGLIRQCIKEALQEPHRKRVPLTALWPFSYPFYKRMGYEVCDLRYLVECNAAALPDPGDARRYRRIDIDQYEPLKPLHDQWIKQSNLSLKRGDLQWRRVLSHPERQIVCFAHDDGYMLWNTKDKQSRTVEIFEWAYLSRDAFLDGISLLKRMSDLNWDKVRWQTSDLTSLLEFGIVEPQPTITVKPGIMARVLHLKAFMEATGIAAPPFSIDDPLGFSDQYRGGGEIKIGPGELIQSTTGFLRVKPDVIPLSMFAQTGEKTNFCVEFF